MAGNGTTVDTAEPGSITLRQLYRSIQDQLALTIERSLALGKKSLAGRLDDVLLRQRFWEEDIRLEDGALSDLEANDAVASSIIRRHLDEIRLLLRDINGTISGSHSEINDESEKMSLLFETNTRLCDQVEIFDAIVAIEVADTARIEREATTIGQLRHQLEEENQLRQSTREKKSRVVSVRSPLRESEVVTVNAHSKNSSEKREGPTAFSAELGSTASHQGPNDSSIAEDDMALFSAPVPPTPISQPIRRAWKGVGSALKEPEISPSARILNHHASVLKYYRTLVNHESENWSHIRTAFEIEYVRAQLWGHLFLPPKRALDIWNLCESILTRKYDLLRKLVMLAKPQGLHAGAHYPPPIERDEYEPSVLWEKRPPSSSMPMPISISTPEQPEQIYRRAPILKNTIDRAGSISEEKNSRVSQNKTKDGQESGEETKKLRDAEWKSRMAYPLPLDRASPGHKTSDKGKEVAAALSASGQGNPREWARNSVRQLSYWNRCLVDLLSPSEQESLRRQLRMNCSTLDVLRLQHLESSSALLGHSDPEQLTKARIAIRQRVSRMQLDDYSHGHLNKLSLLDKNPLWLDHERVGRRSIPPPNSYPLESTTYCDEEVLLQIFRIPDRFMDRFMRPNLEPNLKAVIRHLSCFSEVLNASLLPLGLSSLYISGYLEEDGNRVSCVYRSPPETSSDHIPITLDELLNRPSPATVPDLGKRFEIASAIVKTVHELHIMGLVHGDIEPRNVVFWVTATIGTKLDLGRPYLIGLNMPRSYITRLAISPSTAVKERLEHHHPSGQHIQRVYVPEKEEAFRDSNLSSSSSGGLHLACDDLYSLGLVLIEIMLWGGTFGTRLSNSGILAASNQSLFESKPWKEHMTIRRVGEYAGQEYQNAVIFCLSRELDTVFDSDEWEEELGAYLRQVQVKVVDPIAMCNDH